MVVCVGSKPRLLDNELYHVHYISFLCALLCCHLQGYKKILFVTGVLVQCVSLCILHM